MLYISSVPVIVCLLYALVSGQGPTPKVRVTWEENQKRIEELLEKKNRIALAISGQWLPVPGLAKTFDDLSPNPSFQGTIETFNVRIIDKEAFGPELDVKRVENEVKQFAADQGHEIVAWGEFLGEIRNRPLAYLLAFCVITQKDGETFICPIAFDGPAPFQVLSRASHTGKGPKARSVDCRIR